MRESDPRVIRTRDHIKRCFFELMKEKPAEEISVKELCEVACCSRNTFYMHFQYKDNLYKQLTDECISEIVHGFRPLTSSMDEQTDLIVKQYIHNFLVGIYARFDALKIMIKSDHAGHFREKLADEVYGAIIRTTKHTSGKYSDATDSEEWRLINQYIANGFVGFVIYLVDNLDIPIERSEQILMDLMGPIMYIGEKYLKSH